MVLLQEKQAASRLPCSHREVTEIREEGGQVIDKGKVFGLRYITVDAMWGEPAGGPLYLLVQQKPLQYRRDTMKCRY